jgi:outer membrane protein assembly factor BamB/3',5'-cyclic AMP phosphodiesterase CpdA
MTHPRPIFAALAAFCAAVAAPVTAGLADFTFVHSSDTHVGAGENAQANAALFAEIAALEPRPAFVIATGDICEYGTDAEYAQYQETLKSLGPVQMFPAPGNHDVRWNPRGKEGYTLGTGHPLYESWDHENVHFVTLDSTVLLEHWGHISQEQMNWLKADLEKVGTERPVVIGFHHWIGRDKVQVDNEQALLELVKPYNVVLWLQGHGHSDIQWSVNGVPATMVKGLYQKSYNLIRVTGDSMEITRRFVPDARKQEGEILRDKSVPTDERVVTRSVMKFPLSKRPAPPLSAEAKVSGAKIELTAKAPPNTTLEYRVNTEAAQPLVDRSATLSTADLVPGEHVITVLATLPDKRQFQIPTRVTVPGDVKPKWSVNVGGEVQSRLVKEGNTLYVSSMGNDLVALSAGDGAERFRIRTGGPIFSGAHVDSGTIYFGSADHFVYAADATTGAIKWKTELGGAVLAGTNIAKGIVCVGTTDTKIYGLDAATGVIQWTVQGGNMYQSKTATDGVTFFVGGWDNTFRAIDAATGKENWKLELGKKQKPLFSAFSPAITAPAVGDGHVYVSTNDGILHALQVADGKETWKFDQKKMGYSSPLLHEDRVYVALSDEGKTFCLDAKSGELKWTCDTGSVVYDSSFAFGGGGAQDGHVFIGNVNGTVNAIHADSGKRAWQYRMAPGHLLGSPVADDQTVYMGSMSGEVIALPIKAK